MNKKSLFVVLFAMLCLAVVTVSVSADQLANDRWCNSDQYGCWVTGDNGAQDYIMFWSESARTYFMGPDSKAVVTDYCADCGGKLSMEGAKTTKSVRPLTAEELEMIKDYNELYKAHQGDGVDFYDAMVKYYTNNPDKLSVHYNNYKKSLEN